MLWRFWQQIWPGWRQCDQKLNFNFRTGQLWEIDSIFKIKKTFRVLYYTPNHSSFLSQTTKERGGGRFLLTHYCAFSHTILKYLQITFPDFRTVEEMGQANGMSHFSMSISLIQLFKSLREPKWCTCMMFRRRFLSSNGSWSHSRSKSVDIVKCEGATFRGVIRIWYRRPSYNVRSDICIRTKRSQEVG